jgi:hypothetical protein
MVRIGHLIRREEPDMIRSSWLRRTFAALAVLTFGLGAAACGEVETEGGGTTGGGADAELDGGLDTETGDLGGDMGGDTETEEE